MHSDHDEVIIINPQAPIHIGEYEFSNRYYGQS